MMMLVLLMLVVGYKRPLELCRLAKWNRQVQLSAGQPLTWCFVLCSFDQSSTDLSNHRHGPTDPSDGQQVARVRRRRRVGKESKIRSASKREETWSFGQRSAYHIETCRLRAQFKPTAMQSKTFFADRSLHGEDFSVDSTLRFVSCVSSNKLHPATRL